MRHLREPPLLLAPALPLPSPTPRGQVQLHLLRPPLPAHPPPPRRRPPFILPGERFYAAGLTLVLAVSRHPRRNLGCSPRWRARHIENTGSTAARPISTRHARIAPHF